MEEIWKPIKGFEKTYQVSSLGRVRSIDRVITSGRVRRVKGCIKYQKLRYTKGSSKGYMYVTLSWSKTGHKSFQVHRLVAEAFIPNPEHKPYVDHINRDTTDNRVENLRWATAKENNNFLETRKAHAKYLYKGETAEEYARKLGICCSTFSARIRYGWSVEKACTTPVRVARKEATK